MTNQVMRGLIFVDHIQELRKEIDPKLQDLFKAPVGCLKGVTINRLSEGTVNRIAGNLESAMYNLDIWRDYHVTTVRRLIKPYLYEKLVDGRKRASAVILETLKKNHVNPDIRAIQDWLMKWTNQFKTPDFHYKIGWNWKDFDILGTTEADDNDRSCYAPGGAYRHAPASLATAFNKQAPTFVVLMANDPAFNPENVQARCWGFVHEGNGHERIYISNGYYATNSPQTMTMFKTAIEQATGIRWVENSLEEGRGCWPLYVNGDTQVLCKEDENSHELRSRVAFHNTECVCCKTGEADNGSSVFCWDCLRNGPRVTCGGGCGTMIRARDTRHCGSCGEIAMCETCFNDTHPYCGWCGVQDCKLAYSKYRMVYKYHENGYKEGVACSTCISTSGSYIRCGDCFRFITNTNNSSYSQRDTNPVCCWDDCRAKWRSEMVKELVEANFVILRNQANKYIDRRIATVAAYFTTDDGTAMSRMELHREVANLTEEIPF